jgi:predicted outer membrane protein
VGCALPALLGLVPIPSASSREAYASATAADPVTVWAGSAGRLPLAHVRRNVAAAADACWRRIEAADLACTRTNTPAVANKATQMSPIKTNLAREDLLVELLPYST